MSRADRIRRYAPLTVVAVAVLMAAMVLPSALNLPQTNPTQTLEYAPVPPTDHNQTPPQGNVSALALGTSSSGVAADAAGGNGPGGGPPPGPLNGNGGVPRNKDCVGSPPRQTEDPLAPPCVAYFAGDNGGATYQGVTATEIRILFYFDGGQGDAVTSEGTETRPKNEYDDLDKPPGSNEEVFTRALRRFQAYFNARYQTYNRHVHFIVYYNGGATPTPEIRRQDAAQNFQKVHPFAVVSYASGYQDDYLQAMAQHGVLNFGSLLLKPASFFSRFPGLVWSYLGSLDQQASNFADYVCTQVLPHPVSFSGNAADMGKPRKIGLISAEDPLYPEYTQYAMKVKAAIQKCGGDIVATGTFPISRSCSGTGYDRGSDAQSDATNAANFQQKGVTTVIWPTGMEASLSKQAAAIRYYPEWVLAGDGMLDNFWIGQCEDQTVWDRHAIAVTPAPLVPSTPTTYCYRALREVDPSYSDQDGQFMCGLKTVYEDIRQLFTGIQVAGPRLTVQTMDQGFHAIPHVASTDVHTPACFYETNDYTCVKDMASAWWDKSGVDPNGDAPGCWRMISGGRRYIRSGWPRRDAASQWGSQDPCSGYGGEGLWP